MVEAAFIFPLVIAAVFTVIYILISLYSHTTLQSSLHIELRGAEGLETGLTDRELKDETERDKYRAANEGTHFDIEVNNQLIHPYVFAEARKTFRGTSVFSALIERQYSGRYYLVNDAAVIRNTNLVKGLVKNNGGGDESQTPSGDP